MTNPAKDWLKLFAWVALPLLGFWLYGLFDLDEGFYAAVVAEMNRRGEWITPYFNGRPWFEKPILLYWLAKPSLAVFGGVFGLRLISVLAALGTGAIVAWFGTRRLGLRAGQWSALILGSSLLAAYSGRSFMTDALLSLCLTAAFCTFFESLVGDRRLRLLSALFLGLSVLAKGPVGCILFVLVAGVTFWREKELRPAFRGWWVPGALIFLAIVASWYLPAYLANGQVFVQQFLIEQNWNRFLGGDKAHTVLNPFMWLAYVPVLFLGMMPWSLWLWPALRGAEWRAVRRHRRPADEEPGVGRRSVVATQEEQPGTTDALGAEREPVTSGETPVSVANRGSVTDAARRFLATWAVVVFAFFSLSGAKLPHYILPAVPPLAILVADLFARREREKSARLVPAGTVWTILVVTAVLNVGMAAWYWTGFGATPPQAEAHKLAGEARRLVAEDPAAELAIYKMGRQNKDRGTGKLKLQETDLPSLLFYLDRPALRTDEFADLREASKPVYILTRKGRFTPEETRERGLERVDETDYYALWVWKGDPR